MLLRTSVRIFGEDVRSVLREPSPHQVRQESIALIDWMLAKDDEWWECLPIDDTAAFLAQPARLLYTSNTHDITSKQVALEFFFANYNERIPSQLWEWVIWAMACRCIPEARAIPEPVALRGKRAAKDLLAWVRTEIISEYAGNKE